MLTTQGTSLLVVVVLWILISWIGVSGTDHVYGIISKNL